MCSKFVYKNRKKAGSTSWLTLSILRLKGYLACVRILQSSLLPRLACFAFVFVPNGAGTAKFAENIGIAALEAFLTHIDAVLGAHVAGFSN